jgi:hypothetical protein
MITGRYDNSLGLLLLLLLLFIRGIICISQKGEDYIFNGNILSSFSIIPSSPAYAYKTLSDYYSE